MSNLINELMETTFKQSRLSLARGAFIDEDVNLENSSIYIAKQKQGEYFIYLFVDENQLDLVTKDIQIRLSAFIKEQIESFEQLTETPVEIDQSFDKNSTLIISTVYEVRFNDSIKRRVIEIEEDPYFFKKQVIAISQTELSHVQARFEEFQADFIAYLRVTISDVSKFMAFSDSNNLGLSNDGIEYKFVASMYEKLPFLTLDVEEAKQDNLQLKIEQNLSSEKIVLRNELLSFDENSVDQWIDAIAREVNDD
tara:strand:- start:2910 stop:3668 length:759 start_codon:yes stop_codon:yes gene_type:complete